MSDKPKDTRRTLNIIEKIQLYEAMKAFFQEREDGTFRRVNHVSTDDLTERLQKLTNMEFSENLVRSLEIELFKQEKRSISPEQIREEKIDRICKKVVELEKQLKQEREFRLSLVEAIKKVQPDFRMNLLQAEQYKVTVGGK